MLFHYSRTRADGPGRTVRSPARHLAAVACGLDGVRLVDFTDPTDPVVLNGPTAREAFQFDRGDVRGVALNTVFDIGSAGGGIQSGERDYLYLWVDQGNDGNRQQRVHVFDVSDPWSPRRVEQATPRIYGGTGELLLMRAYNEPFLQHFVVAAGAGGLGTVVDVSRAPTVGADVLTTWEDLSGLRDLAFEELAFDRLVDERQRWIKDISHEDCRYLERDELLKVLNAEIPIPGYATDRYGHATGDLSTDQRTRRTR